MLDLAANHKNGLAVHSAVLLGAGSIGLGDAFHPDLEPARFGAAVVGPLTRRSTAGAPPPRLADTTAGLVLQTGGQNRGVSSATRKLGRLWPRLGCPVTAQIADVSPQDAQSSARSLSQVACLEALELACPLNCSPRELSRLTAAVLSATELPLFVKLPLHGAEALAEAAAHAGAAGLVVGSPPRGAGILPDGAPVQGHIYGPGVFPLMLEALLLVNRQGLPCSLLACGGVHTREHVSQCLAAGAQAVQLDSLAWIEPAAATDLATQFTVP